VRETFSKALQILSPRERRQLVLLAAFGVMSAFVQIGSIASIMPFMAVLANPEMVESNRFFAWAYSYFGFETQHQFLFALGCLVFVAMLAGIVVNAISTLLQEHYNAYTGARLSERLLVRYLRRPYAYFITRNTSELTKNLYGEITQLVTGVIAPCIHLVAQGITAVAVFLLLAFVDPMLALTVGVIVGGAYVMIYYAVRRRLTTLGEGRLIANRDRFKAGAEAFGGIKDIKLLGREAVYTENFSNPARRIARFSVLQRLIGHIPRYAMEAVAFGGMLIIILYLITVRRDITSALPLLALYALAGYRMMPILQQMFHNFAELRSSWPVLNNIHRELFASFPGEEEEQARIDTEERLPVRRKIELQNVTYCYPGSDRAVLEDFNLEIEARTTIGLVGATGSGKTTAVDLILGLLRPTSGALVVDGLPVEGPLLRKWQNCLGYISQTVYLADKSVAANIALGVAEEEIDMDRVRKCAAAACLDDFIEHELPQGYKTTVGERGVRLSGGQRQRVGIARALYSNPEVLVLDEATSALDTVTEQEVMKNIRALGGTKTIIIIAHRLTTVRLCDRIYQLEKGSVCATGTYDELLNGSSSFQALAQAH